MKISLKLIHRLIFQCLLLSQFMILMNIVFDPKQRSCAPAAAARRAGGRRRRRRMEIICLCLIREIDRSKVVSWSKLLVVLRKFSILHQICVCLCAPETMFREEKRVFVIDIQDKIESNLHRKLNSFRVCWRKRKIENWFLLVFNNREQSSSRERAMFSSYLTYHRHITSIS